MRVCIGVESLTDLPRVHIRVDGNRPNQSDGETQSVVMGCEVYIRVDANRPVQCDGKTPSVVKV